MPDKPAGTDNLAPAQRRRAMQAVRDRDPAPERRLRRLIHAMGYRYRLHRRDLPGTPDMVFPRRGAVIFVHGCWWHAHRCPRGDRVPATRADYWITKRDRNRRRDQRVQRQLRSLGWRVMVVWECQLGNQARLRARVRRFLGP